MKQDAGWEKCDWDCKHGISAGREKLFGQEDSRMEIGRKYFVAGGDKHGEADFIVTLQCIDASAVR